MYQIVKSTNNELLPAYGTISSAFFFVHLYTRPFIASTTNQIESNFIGLHILFLFHFPYCRCYIPDCLQQQENGQQRQSSMACAHSSTAKQQHKHTRLQSKIKLVRTQQVRLVSSYCNEESTTKCTVSAMLCPVALCECRLRGGTRSICSF